MEAQDKFKIGDEVVFGSGFCGMLDCWAGGVVVGFAADKVFIVDEDHGKVIGESLSCCFGADEEAEEGW